MRCSYRIPDLRSIDVRELKESMNDIAQRGGKSVEIAVTNRSIKILELVNYWKDNGDKTRTHPPDNRGRVI